MTTPLVGAHVSTAGGMDKAIDRALSIEAAAVQIFVKSNMQWFAGAPFTKAELHAFHGHAKRDRLATVFAHSGYMINLAATNPDFLEKSRRALGEELSRADQLELPFLVLHPGAHLGAGVEAGLGKVVESLDAVFEKSPGLKCRVALETTAGQGSSLGCEFEHLAFILKHVREPERLCVCVDTAHLFAAGYDISTDAEKGSGNSIGSSAANTLRRCISMIPKLGLARGLTGTNILGKVGSGSKHFDL